MAVARYYDPEKNKEGAAFPGVPLDDVTEEQWASTPEWLQRSVDASPMYRKTKVSGPKPVEAPQEADKADGGKK